MKLTFIEIGMSYQYLKKSDSNLKNMSMINYQSNLAIKFFERSWLDNANSNPPRPILSFFSYNRRPICTSQPYLY